MISPVRVEPTGGALTETTSVAEVSRRFEDLRGVQWRIDLGILPSSPSSSIDDLRRVTANSRRRYAAMRRQLLVDPHISKDGSSSPDLVMDNPLSQNPDSMWGRFFKNAELERMVDQDLTRLYPEHGSYFQTSACQNMLRRILLLWCLRYPAYGYRQGMHELLAPLLYVLHVDVEHLSEVRKTYEDHFTDQFDGFSFHQNDLSYKFDFKKFSDSIADEIGSAKGSEVARNPSELDPKIQTMILLSDAYGAEGELGVVLSDKFMEHDAYCMFDALMSGSGGVVAMSEFFSPSPFGSSHSGFPPVIEASAALYHLLSIVDSSLYSHLVELGVEPQYFALRWLRVLFGREFALEDLLIIWDEIFACGNCRLNNSAESDLDSSSGVLDSARGAFISAFAVSMILHLRSSLLATENATSCLQRLLNFPDDVKLPKLIKKAKSLQTLAVDANSSAPLPVYTGTIGRSKSTVVRGHSLSLDSTSPKTPLTLMPDSYWEEKWRVLHKEEERKQDALGKEVPAKKGWSEKVKLRLSRTQSGPCPSEVGSRKKNSKIVRRSLLKDLARQLGADEDADEILSHDPTDEKEPEVDDSRDFSDENFDCTAEPICLSGNAASEENSSIFSDPPSPASGLNDHVDESGRSSVASNSSLDENDTGPNPAEVCVSNIEGSTIAVSDTPGNVSSNSSHTDDIVEKPTTNLKERKPISSKFQWFWKFGRGAGEGMSDKGQITEVNKECDGTTAQDNIPGTSTANGGVITSPEQSKGESVDQNVMATLRNLGQSMLENIQVIPFPML
ncbi:OLC1v1035990C4 [Oldenlandia corymbosa var. corymbosa]|uniref:OLC1v1035990C4 n=1 Tax=Oldenlandia corymbosa var. corymbosa TaxID=529605 RepID=A0AAV1CUP5_OLDCO|nr:OLC1v1035990C4 [Oldenlandia corymbosa var. corymbosa]